MDIDTNTRADTAPSTSVSPMSGERLAVLQRAILRCEPARQPSTSTWRRRAGSITARPGGTADDASLVVDARLGDEDAFRELFSRHAAAVRMAIGDRVRDRDRQQDLVQDSFVRAFARLASLREPSCFRPWLLRIARNIAADEVRRDVRRPVRLAAEPFLESLCAQPHDEPAAVFDLHQLVGAVEAGLAALSSRDNRVLALSATNGCGISDIAEELGVTTGTAKVILHRARRRLLEAIA